MYLFIVEVTKYHVLSIRKIERKKVQWSKGRAGVVPFGTVVRSTTSPVHLPRQAARTLVRPIVVPSTMLRMTCTQLVQLVLFACMLCHANAHTCIGEPRQHRIRANHPPGTLLPELASAHDCKGGLCLGQVCVHVMLEGAALCAIARRIIVPA